MRVTKTTMPATARRFPKAGAIVSKMQLSRHGDDGVKRLRCQTRILSRRKHPGGEKRGRGSLEQSRLDEDCDWALSVWSGLCWSMVVNLQWFKLAVTGRQSTVVLTRPGWDIWTFNTCTPYSPVSASSSDATAPLAGSADNPVKSGAIQS